MKLLARWRQRPDPGADWFAKIQSGAIDVREDAAFVRWLAADARNEVRYENNELAWELSMALRERPALRALLADVDADLRGARGRPASRGRRLGWSVGLAAAATLVVAAVASWIIVGRGTLVEYSTAVGELRVVALEDGSRLTLNTATHVAVRLQRGRRDVELRSGEALFAVHPDASRPFSVTAHGGVTTAVGTEFDVRLTGSGAEVAVLEGAVAVRRSGDAASSRAVRVGAGQAVGYADASGVGTVHAADANRIAGWQLKRIVFSDESLTDAIDEYNRYVDRPIVLAAPGLAARRVHGVFRTGDEDAFVHALEGALPLRAERTDAGVTLVPK